MNYKHLDEKKKAQIDILYGLKYSMREIGKKLNISHSTVSRYLNKPMRKKKDFNIHIKYKEFIAYLLKYYDWKTNSIEACVYQFKKYHSRKASVSAQQVYNWINANKIDIRVEDTCYKRKKGRRRRENGMMKHCKWNIENKTVLPIRLRPKYIEKRDEIGHLEIDSIIGKRNEHASILSIVDRCTRRMWLIKAEAKNEYYIDKLIRKYIEEEQIEVKSITVDNGLEFQALGITAKRLGVKLYKCDPYCSFQRGTNERANALVRRFIPKGKSMYQVSQQYLEDISFQINSMKRKLFDFKSSFDVEYEHIVNGAL